MRIRYYINPAAGLAHIYEHNISEREVEAVLERPLQDLRGQDYSRIAIGRTEDGRYLKVICVPDPVPSSVFDITANELGPKAKRAIRRKQRKKR